MFLKKKVFISSCILFLLPLTCQSNSGDSEQEDECNEVYEALNDFDKRHITRLHLDYSDYFNISTLTFKKGDLFELCPELSWVPNVLFLAKSMKTKKQGFVPRVMVAKADGHVTNITALRPYDDLEKGIGIASENLNASNLKGFISYSEGDVVTIIQYLDLDFLLVKSQSTEEVGLIHADEVAQHLAIALFNFNPTEDHHYDDIQLNFRKGELFYAWSFTLTR